MRNGVTIPVSHHARAVAFVAVLPLPGVAHSPGMHKVLLLVVQFFDLLPPLTLLDDGMAEVAIGADGFALGGGVFPVMAPVASRKVEVPDI